MASTAAAAKAPAEAAPEAQPKKSKLLLIIVLAVVLLAGAGAGAWFFMQGDADDEEEKVQTKPPVFLPVDQFTVNLQPEEGQQYLQVTMTLKVTDTAVSDAIKARMPEVRSRVLMLLSSKKPSQLVAPEGKLKLAEAIAQEVEASLPQEKTKPKKKARADDEKPAKKKGKKAKSKEEDEEEETPAPQRVLAVYFTHFIVQ